MTPEQELELLTHADEATAIEYIAMRVRRERTRLGLTQSEFARQAGVALRTYKRLELEGSGTINTLARIMLALGHARGFYTLFPHPKPEDKPSLIKRLENIEKSAQISEARTPMRTKIHRS